jgi:glyoxylase-like metal-dependent hydrolase (beta-lactamase superfamily II)
MCWKQTLAVIALAAAPLAAQNGSAHHAPKPPKSLRLYIFDCGVLKPADAKSYGFDKVAELKMSVPCFLVAHPKGTMMWDVGVVPDSDFKADGAPVEQGMISVARPLKPQLEAIGYEPEDIKYIAFSHYHIDHTANANMFAGSTWLVSQPERDIMFSDKPAPVRVEKNYIALKDSKTTILPTTGDYDVFGDGTVIIKQTPGHTPGHQVLFLKLPKTGPVLIASRAKIEEFLKTSGAQLWIEHDFAANAKLKKSPAYYE